MHSIHNSKKSFLSWTHGLFFVIAALATCGYNSSAQENAGNVPESAKSASAPAVAQDEGAFRDVAGELRCPTCQGLSILESSAPFSEQLKQAVRDQLGQGKSKDDILSFFEQRYGAWILRSPPKKGFNLLAWGLPIALILGGPPLIYFFIWRRRREVKTWGVRGTEDILIQFENEVQALRRQKESNSSHG